LPYFNLLALEILLSTAHIDPLLLLVISAFSLQALVDISRHDTLGSRLNHLVIGLDNLGALANSADWTLEQYTEHQKSADSQQDVLDTGEAVELLTKALVHLPNLNTIDLRTFNSPTRYRDNGRWTSYGYSESPLWFRHVHGGRLTNHSEIRIDFVRRIFKSVLVSLGRSNRPVRSLEYLARHDVFLPDQAFSMFAKLGCVHHELSDVLLRLTKLHLDLHLGRMMPTHLSRALWSASENNAPSTAAQISDPGSANFRRFLASTPNVTWLRLNFSANDNAGARFLAWLSLSPGEVVGWSETNPNPVALPLTRLDLGNSTFAPETLTRIFAKFNKLESCCLRAMVLRQCRADDDDDDDDDDNDGNDDVIGDGDRRGWARVFRRMVTHAPNLKHLSLHDLRERNRHRTDNVVFVRANETSYGTNYDQSIEIPAVDRLSLETLSKRTWRLSSYLESRSRHQMIGGDNDSAGSEDIAESELMSADEDEMMDDDGF